MKVLDGLKDSLVPAMKALEAPGDERGREEIDKLMLPWVQGVQDDEYNSPSESFSGSALEQLRKRKSSRSPSPCSPGTRTGGDDDVLVQPTQHAPAVMCQDISQDKDTPLPSGQRSMKDFISKTKKDCSQTPGSSFALKKAGKRHVDDILAGLEVDMNTTEKETPKTMLLPASFPSSGESNKENTSMTKRKKAVQTSTTRKARASRRAIEQAKTPSIQEPTSEEKRRIPARLLPWSCAMCTFENIGNAVACEMCEHVKEPDGSQTCPDTVAQQKSIAKSCSAKKRQRKTSANDSHMIESTPIRPRRKMSVKVPVEDEECVPEGDDVDERPSQVTLTGTQGRSKRGKRMESRLARVCSKKESKTAKDEHMCSLFKAAVVTASNLNPDDKATLKSFCRSFGAHYSSNWTPKVTHVICPGSDQTAKTFKYLMATLTGTHIVSMEWIQSCTASGMYEREDAYLLSKSSTKSTDLLAAYEIQVQQTLDGSGNVKQVKDLLKAAGAKVVNRLPRSDDDRHGIIIVLDQSGNDTSDASSIVEQAWFGRACGANIPVVKQAWLRSSILEGAPSDIQEFTI